MQHQDMRAEIGVESARTVGNVEMSAVGCLGNPIWNPHIATGWSSASFNLVQSGVMVRGTNIGQDSALSSPARHHF